VPLAQVASAAWQDGLLVAAAAAAAAAVYLGSRQVLWPRGCDESTDTEHHLLFECPALADVQAAFPDDELHLADGDLGRLMDEVYHPETVEAILDFTFDRITKAISGPSA
jgi:hypothetical protein